MVVYRYDNVDENHIEINPLMGGSVNIKLSPQVEKFIKEVPVNQKTNEPDDSGMTVKFSLLRQME